jgi:hypothetical protein
MLTKGAEQLELLLGKGVRDCYEARHPPALRELLYSQRNKNRATKTDHNA